MNTKRKTFSNPRFLTALMVLSVALIAFMSYREMLGYFFTATDSPTLIDTGRILSLRDVRRIFSEPLTNGTTLTELSLFYRPVATLSHSLDYFMWGLNPFGHHLTDLILHISVSVLVFFLLRLLTRGNQVAAWLGAIIFTTHPILVESVPAIARRHDLIAALFLLASLLVFVKVHSTAYRKTLLFSVLLYIFGLMAKEIAVILPPLIFGYSLIFSSQIKPFNFRIRRSLKSTSPYVAATLVVLSFRAYILHGVGGYDAALMPVSTVINFFANTSLDYFVALLYPAPFLRSFFNPFPSTFDQIGALLALVCLLISLMFYRRVLFRLAGHNEERITKYLKILLVTLVILSSAGILAYPLMAPHINQSIQEAYYGQGPKFLIAAMTNRHVAPVEDYFFRAGQILYWAWSNLLFGCAFCLFGLIIIDNRDKIKRFLMESDNGKVVTFFLLWLSIPLGIYLFTFTFTHRYMYLSVIPFGGILSILMYENARAAIRTIREHDSNGFASHKALSESPLWGFLLITALTGSLTAYSPLLRRYGEWEDSAKISSSLLHRLSRIVTELPNDAVIYIFNLPERIASYESEIPRVKTVSYLADYSIKSWVDLNHPANQMKVVVCSRSKPAFYPRDLDFEINKGQENDVMITVGSDGNTALSTEPTAAACPSLMTQRIPGRALAVN